mgnify:CR=1 FL=1
MSLPCHLVRDLMPAACGGDLDPATAAAIERHAGECVACRREQLQYEGAREALTTLVEGGAQAPQLGDDFFASLRSGILGEIERGARLEEDTRLLVAAHGKAAHGKAVHSKRRFALLTWLPAAAALVVTLAGGYLIGRSHLPEQHMVRSSVASSSHAVPTRTVLDDEVKTRSASALLSRPDFAPYLQEALQRFVQNLANEGVTSFGDGSILLPVSGVNHGVELSDAALHFGMTKDY